MECVGGDGDRFIENHGFITNPQKKKTHKVGGFADLNKNQVRELERVLFLHRANQSPVRTHH